MTEDETLNEMRLRRALDMMWHEPGSSENIREWNAKQRDFWGGVHAVKEFLWRLQPEPLRGLYRTGVLRSALKTSMPNKVSVSHAQLAVALAEMGFTVLFKNAQHFNTDFPSKRIVERLQEERS